MNTLMRSSTISANNGGHHAARKIHQARADQIAQAFHVAHDPRDQRAGLIRIVKSDRQPADVRLHLFAQVGDHALRRFGEKLRQREGSDSLHRRCRPDRQRQRHQQAHLMLAHHVIDQELRGCRQDQPRQPIDGHQTEAKQQKPSCGRTKRPSLIQQMNQSRCLALGRSAGAGGPGLRPRLGCVLRPRRSNSGSAAPILVIDGISLLSYISKRNAHESDDDSTHAAWRTENSL